MTLVNSVPVFNSVNHGFMYLCQDDTGKYWLRSVAGKWVQIETSAPLDTNSVVKDFDNFLLSGVQVTENDVKVENASQTVVDPIEIIDVTPIEEEPPLEEEVTP